VCDVVLSWSSGAGRPRSYCGVPCRRQAENELRRARRLVARLERRSDPKPKD
jgi:hypothetical protein